jgi:hypothetical protein
MTIRTLTQQYRPICGLHAIALATPDKDVPDVWAYFKPRKGPSWKGRLYWSELLDGLSQFKVKYSDISQRVNGKSAIRAIDELECGKQHLVLVTGHYFTFKDGLFYDQYYNEGKPLKGSHLARKKVRRVVTIH